MTIIATASAPGKLFLTGEYAVLLGGRAVGMAVERRARAELSAGTGDWNTLNVRGYACVAEAFRLSADGTVRWRDAAAANNYNLVAAAIALPHFRSRLQELQPFCLTLDTSGFFESGRKLGLGSSAALTVALTAVFSRATGQDFRVTDALDAHTAKQSGRGSGVDVILCAEGGVRILQSPSGGPVSDAIAWPRQLHYAVVDSGVPASTPALLDAFFEWRDRATDAKRVLQRLVACADAAAAVWCAGDARQVIEAIAGYSAQLRDMDKASGIGLFSRGHSDLYGLAMLNSLAYKPSGAGAGDFGIAFGDDVGRLEDFSRQAADAGFAPAHIERSVDGVVTQ